MKIAAESNPKAPARRRTKIVCTIGPKTDSPEMIAALIAAGMDVVRLNFSHGDHASHGRVIDTVRRASKAAGRPVGLLQDLCGPKIRLGQLEGEQELVTGQRISLSGSGAPGALPVTYPHLAEDLKAGDRILLADGQVELVVEAVEGGAVNCRVLAEGVVSSGKGVNLPSANLRIPAFTDKDRADLEFGLKMGVDFVALSFVRSQADLEPALEMLNSADHRPLLIAKIEKPEAVERLTDIVSHVDGLMVARGDLGVEMPLEEVPMIQKRIIETARRAAKPVITATQMLRSMTDSPRPTRAEAADVANAVLDGTDAVMLSDETAVGKFPVEAVKVLDRVARAVEPHLDNTPHLKAKPSGLVPATEAAISRAACWLAKDINPAAVIASTSSGATARLISRLRPEFNVLGLSPDPVVWRQLTLSWGVIPGLLEPYDDAEAMFDLARAWVKENALAKAGQRVIVTAGVPAGTPGSTNLIRVLEI